MSGRDENQKQLWKLVQKGSLKNLEEFLSKLGRNDVVTLLEKKHKASGDSVMHLACRHGILPIVKHLHGTWGIGLQMRNLDDKTPLHEAAAAGQFGVCQYLLDDGVSVDALKRSDWTPLMLACTRNSNLSVVKLLVDRGANVHLVNKDGWNCFHIACRVGDVSILTYLLDVGPAVWKTVSNNGRTPIHTASLHGREQALNVLIQNCAFSLNVQDSCGSTPLMEAVKGGHISIVKLLVACEVDVNLVDGLGRSALHVAAETGRSDDIEYFVKECDLDPNIRSNSCGAAKSGHTPLDWAYKENQLKAVATLRVLGAIDSLH